MNITTDSVVNSDYSVSDGEYLLVETEKMSVAGTVRLHSKDLRDMNEIEGWDCSNYINNPWSTRDNLTTRLRNVTTVSVINNQINGVPL